MKTFILLILVFSFTALAGEWKFDKAHTSIGFQIAHMVITDVEGNFNKFEGMVKTSGDDFEGAQIEVTIDPASVNTNEPKRDEHLVSADFFNVEKYPEMTFVSKSFKKVGDNKYKMAGDLTMHGVTKPVELEVTYRGEVKDPWGNTRAGFKATGMLNRYDYDLKYNSVLEAGGLLIGKEVAIELNVELIKN